uniref:Putative ovule protein n=1 Tax=Solanum chacoense TaxID=4108 RepID=A0A0V0GRZ0_SOLCH
MPRQMKNPCKYSFTSYLFSYKVFSFSISLLVVLAESKYDIHFGTEEGYLLAFSQKSCDSFLVHSFS